MTLPTKTGMTTNFDKDSESTEQVTKENTKAATTTTATLWCASKRLWRGTAESHRPAPSLCADVVLARILPRGDATPSDHGSVLPFAALPNCGQGLNRGQTLQV